MGLQRQPTTECIVQKYQRLLENMYGEFENYNHIKKDKLHEYRKESIRELVQSDASLSYINTLGTACIIGTCVRPWYDPSPVAIENIFYIHPDFRTLKNAQKTITEWVNKGIVHGVREFHAGSLIGYRTDAVVRLYRTCGFVQQGLTLVRRI